MPTLPLSNLPAWLLSKILAYISEREIRKLRTVCKSWDSYFKAEVGLRLIVKNSNWTILSYQMKRFRIFSKLKFSDVTIPLSSVIEMPGHLLLTSLSFHRIITTGNVFWSLKNFTNLKNLAFNHILLEKSPKPFSHKDQIILPQLETIYLFSKTENEFGTVEDDIFVNSSCPSLPKDEVFILDFLSNICYERLQSLYLFCSEEVLMSQPFQELFDGHSNINKMSCLTKLMYKNRKTLRQFISGPGTSNVVLAWLFQPGEIIWRKQMQIEICDSYLEIPLEWDVMFQMQRKLEFIRVNGAYRHWTALQTGIAKCSKTITEIRLAGGGFGSSSDLAGFTDCNKLVRLDVMLDECYLKNIQRLPPSLRHLSLNGPLTLEDLQVISNQLVNLEFFYLNGNLPSTKYTFYGDNLVIPGSITKSVLKRFLTLPKISSLTFRNTRIEVLKVSVWLESISGIDVELYPVQGYPTNAYGSLDLQIPFRKYPRAYCNQ